MIYGYIDQRESC